MLGMKRKDAKFTINYRKRNACFYIVKRLQKLLICNREITFLCIGTDRVLLDIFGPLVGTLLKKSGVENVFGVLGQPVHAKNINETIAKLPKENLIVSIDAMSGAKENLGNIKLRKGKCYPGTGVHRKLAPVGDIVISFNVVVEKNGRIEPSAAPDLIWCGAKVVAEGIVETLRKIKYSNEPVVINHNLLPRAYQQVLFNHVR